MNLSQAETNRIQNREKLRAILNEEQVEFPPQKYGPSRDRPPTSNLIAQVPVGPGSVLDLTPGFHITTGATGVGKTVTMWALSEFLNDWIAKDARLSPALQKNSGLKGGPGLQRAYYRYIGEPGATPDFATPLSIPLELASCGPNSVVVLDSVTYFLSMLGSTLTEGESITYEKGLRDSDILAVRYLDNLARVKNQCIFGVLNTDLFPRTNVLEGAAEGFFTVTSLGSAVYRNRYRRVVTNLSLQFASAKAVELYGKSAGSIMSMF